MLQIDDAGSGSFVGGTCIGIYRPETNEYCFDIIPVELYNKENFKKKLYLDEVVNIAASAIKTLAPEKGEIIEICRGYMFDRLKVWLEDHGYTWYCTQITGRIQEIVERNFELYAQTLGLPWQYIKYTHYPFHFHKLLKWVFADFDNRISHCKVGWHSWEKIECVRPEVSYGSMNSAAYTCLKCGRRLRQGCLIKILKYTSNQDNYVYLHKEC